MRRIVDEFIMKNELVKEKILVRVEREDDWYIVTLKGMDTCYTSDCYFKDFSELMKYTLNMAFKILAMEEEITKLKGERDYGRDKQDI
jgi:hypothetical protein